MLYPAHSRVGRGNLLLRHSVPHFSPSRSRVGIEPTTTWFYSHAFCHCATTGLKLFRFYFFEKCKKYTKQLIYIRRLKSWAIASIKAELIFLTRFLLCRTHWWECQITPTKEIRKPWTWFAFFLLYSLFFLAWYN